MMKYLAAFVLCSLYLVSCGNGPETAADHPAYHNPVVQPFTDSIESDPEHAAFYFQRAAALADIRMDSLALEDVKKAAELDSANPQYTYTIGYLQLQLDRPKEAVRTLLHNLQQSPGNVNVRLLLSKAYLAAHEVQPAQEQIDKILAADPAHPAALMTQARIMAMRQDTAAAIGILKRLTASGASSYEASYLLADWYRASGDPQAVAQYEATFRMDTTDVNPLYEIGELYEQQSRFSQAKEMYQACIRKDRDFTEAYLKLGKILYRENATEKALRHFRMAIQTQPNSGEAYLYKGRCFERLGQKDSARIAYRQALVFDNSLKEAAEGLKRTKDKQ